MCCGEVQIMVAECKVTDEKYAVYVSEANVHKIIILDKEVVVLSQLISQMESTKLM